MSKTRKANVRKRLKAVDAVIDALAATGIQCKALDKALELPKSSEMPPREKYTVFSRKDGDSGYRKSLHKVPHYTKIPLDRTSPAGF